MRLDEVKRDILRQYGKMYAQSEQLHKRGGNSFVNGTSQSGRNMEPFPPYIVSANAQNIFSIDGVKLTDYWLGHFIQVLGHGASSYAVKHAVENFGFFQTGQVNPNEIELAYELSKLTRLDRFSFLNTGAQTTMLGVMCAISHTGRNRVMKMAGGWHGVQPWAMKGIRDYRDSPTKEFSGIIEDVFKDVITIKYNDLYDLEKKFKLYGNQAGVLILELALGNSGMVLAERTFASRCEELCNHYGVVLFVDEIVTGFRTKRALFSDYYGLNPQLIALGKALSGGMPLAVLAGTREVMDQMSTRKANRVPVDMGTFTSHPGAIVSSLDFIKRFSAGELNSEKVDMLMSKAREGLKDIASLFKINLIVTGESFQDGIPNFPIGTVRYSKCGPRNANDYNHWSHDCYDNELRDSMVRIFLLTKGIFAWQGLGAISSAHNEPDIDQLLGAYKEFFFNYLPFLGSEIRYG